MCLHGEAVGADEETNKLVDADVEKGGAAGDGHSSGADDGDGDDDPDKDADAAAAVDDDEKAARRRIRWEDEGGTDAAAAGKDDDWARASVGQRLSMAGPGGGEPPARVKHGRGRDAAARDDLINPVGYEWRSAVPLSELERLKALQKAWFDQNVGGDDDVAGDMESLPDAWQSFAARIVDAKAADRDARGEYLFGYKPLRMFLFGSAGTGKSSVVRKIVRQRKARVAAMKGAVENDVKHAVLLGAPTGCASFQMKNGASTVHRL